GGAEWVRRDARKGGWRWAGGGRRSNRRPALKMLSLNRAASSRPSYSNGIGGIEMKTSSVRSATTASTSADSHARTNFATIASSAGEPDAGGGLRVSGGRGGRCRRGAAPFWGAGAALAGRGPLLGRPFRWGR